MGIITHKIIDGNVVEFHKVVITKISGEYMYGTSEVYARGLLYNWRSSKAGQFVYDNAVGEVEYEKYVDPSTMETSIAIVATLEKKKLSEYYMRFDKRP